MGFAWFKFRRVEAFKHDCHLGSGQSPLYGVYPWFSCSKWHFASAALQLKMTKLSLSLLVCLKFWPMPIAYLKIACFVHLQSGAEFTLRSYIDVHINPCSTCPPWQPGDVGLKLCWPPLRPQRFALISYWVPELSWDMMSYDFWLLWSMKIRWFIELQFPTCQVRVPLFVTELHTPTRAHTPTHLDGHIYTH